MGWLRDLMVGAPDAPSSFGELARRLLACPDWPRSTRMRERSLSALFSKLDRGEGLEWLVDRPSVQHLIAETLGCSVAEVRRSIGAVPAAAGPASRLVRLRALPRSKTIDLLDEQLFPGLPPRVLKPESWGALWWRAPQSSGRSLVGQWLHARGRARLGPDSAPADERGVPLFIELHAREQVPSCPPSGPFCVAAPFAPPESWPDVEIINSPPAQQCLSELVSWIGERLPSAAGFDVAWVIRWLSSPEFRTLADTAGAVLDLCGILDELGREKVAALSPRQLGAQWLSARVHVAVDRQDPAASRMKESGLDLLTGIVARTLMESDQPWDTPRDFDTWRGLVPEEYQREADVEWMEWSLARTAGTIRPRDIRRAARELPPGAFRALRTLTQIGVLCPTAEYSALLALTPRWLSNLARLQAERTLAEGSALTWGEVLLKPGVERLHDAVAQRLNREPSMVIESALEEEATHEPGYASAIETLVVHSGLAVLAAPDHRPDAALALLEEQLALLVELPDSPPAPRAWPAWIAGTDVFHGLWLLGVLALSEDSFPKSRRGTYFDVWRAPKLPSHWRHALDLIAGAVRAHCTEPWVPAAFGAVDRLRRAVASVAADGLGWHYLERPGLFVEEAQHGALTWHTVLEMGTDGASARGVEWLARSQEAPWSVVAEATWHAWCEVGGPSIENTLLDPSLEVSAPFWPHCPPQALELLAKQRDAIAFERLTLVQWQRIARDLAQGLPSVLERAAAWKHLPSEFVDMLFQRSDGLSDAAWRELWRHHPQRALAAARKIAGPEPNVAAHIAVLAPASASAASIEVLQHTRLVNLDRSERGQVREWLHCRIRGRDPEWRQAHAILFELDQALATLPQV